VPPVVQVVGAAGAATGGSGGGGGGSSGVAAHAPWLFALAPAVVVAAWLRRRHRPRSRCDEIETPPG
jgi:hypothetical protein